MGVDETTNDSSATAALADTSSSTTIPSSSNTLQPNNQRSSTLDAQHSVSSSSINGTSSISSSSTLFSGYIDVSEWHIRSMYTRFYVVDDCFEVSINRYSDLSPINLDTLCSGPVFEQAKQLLYGTLDLSSDHFNAYSEGAPLEIRTHLHNTETYRDSIAGYGTLNTISTYIDSCSAPFFAGGWYTEGSSPLYESGINDRELLYGTIKTAEHEFNFKIEVTNSLSISIDEGYAGGGSWDGGTVTSESVYTTLMQVHNTEVDLTPFVTPYDTTVGMITFNAINLDDSLAYYMKSHILRIDGPLIEVYEHMVEIFRDMMTKSYQSQYNESHSAWLTYKEELDGTYYFGFSGHYCDIWSIVIESSVSDNEVTQRSITETRIGPKDSTGSSTRLYTDIVENSNEIGTKVAYLPYVTTMDSLYAECAKVIAKDPFDYFIQYSTTENGIISTCGYNAYNANNSEHCGDVPDLGHFRGVRLNTFNGERLPVIDSYDY
ncbi:MAG: hypothetical protein OCD76_25665 [Reichenbachiella sp.]